MSAYTGRDVMVEFAIGNETDNPAGLTWKLLGMMTDKGFKLNWSEADTTASDSPEFTMTSIVTFKAVTFDGNGISYTDALYNQAELKAHAYNPGSATDNQPKVWLRETAPDGVTQGPMTMVSWEASNPHAGAATWSFSAKSNGAVTFAPA